MPEHVAARPFKRGLLTRPCEAWHVAAPALPTCRARGHFKRLAACVALRPWPAQQAACVSLETVTETAATSSDTLGKRFCGRHVSSADCRASSLFHRCACNPPTDFALPQVSSKIGKGAYGSVWQATVAETGDEVVVKVIFPDPDLDPQESGQPSEEKLSSFRREIEIMSVLGKHPNITAIRGITSDSRVLILEESMTDLHQMIKSEKRSLSLPMVTRWAKDMLDGVAYLHSIDVMHRDLKPSNMLIFKDLTLKLGDFGLSREASPTEAVKVQRETCTLWYRAPELIMGDLTYNSKIDVWSMGCIIMEMLVGRCATAGRVEDVCQCPKPTHFNYNSDQLAKIFRLVGTPTDKKFLSKMACYQHFESWPHYQCSIEDIVSDVCTAKRLAAEPTTDDEKEVADLARQWTECVSGMLVIDPAQRQTASEALKASIWSKVHAQPAVLEQNKPYPSPSSQVAGFHGNVKYTSTRCSVRPSQGPLKLSIRRKKSVAQAVMPLQPLQPLKPDGLAADRERSSHKDDIYAMRALGNNLPPLVVKGNTPPGGPAEEKCAGTTGSRAISPTDVHDMERPMTRRANGTEDRPPTRSRSDRRPRARGGTGSGERSATQI